MKRRVYFWLGILIFILLTASYFIKLNVESGGNYTTRTSLLAVLIFYNPFVLAFYILIGIVLVVKGKKRKVLTKKL